MNEPNASDLLVMPSGLRVIAIHRPWSKMFAATLVYGVGTFDDPPKLPGTSHFAEHLAFAGENKEVVAKVTAAGTQVHGATSYDHTMFQAAGHVDELDHSLLFFANILRSPPVTESDIAGERDVFFHELESADGEHARLRALDSFRRRNLGDINWRKSQTKKSVRIKRFKADGLNSFRQRFYRPANGRLAIVSPLPIEELISKIESYLPHGDGGDAHLEPIHRPDPPVRRTLKIKWDLSRYVWVSIMQTVYAPTLSMRLSADIIGRILGGGPHSLLFQKLRREWGVAYDVYADDSPHLSSTSVHCFFSVWCRSFRKSMNFALDCVNQLAADGITEVQLASEKRQLIRRHEMAVDNPVGLAWYLAYEALRPNYSDSIPPRKYCDAVDSLTLSDVNQAVGELCATRNRAIFVSGQIGPLSLLRLLTRRAP
jgi:predicted Zn-dependent peptidase